jgi:hypothetical protein
MANTIKHRQSAVNGKVPTTAQIQLGELAVNTYDGKLYLKKNVLGTETVVDVSGSVTSLSIASANGFAGTVTTATTTPAITLSTSITGLLKGDGTSISAATAGTDYQVPISGGASTITASDLTASRALISNSSGKVAVSTATDTELGYLSGVTSAIQTQINGKAGTTTANTFTNNQIISVNSSSDALRITQTGAGNALVVEDSTPDSTPFVVDASGRLIVGSTTALTYSNSSPNVPNLQINALGSATAGISRFSPNSAGNSCWFLKSRGATAGAFDVVASGDTLGTIGFLGADGTDGIRAATISAQVDGTPGTNDMPGRLVFSTTADGASSPTERMRIDNQGRVGIGGTAGADTQLQLLGTYATSGAVTRVVRANGTIPSSTTGTARIYGTEITTQAASFTVSSLQHFYAAQATLGLGSAVTNQYGFLAEASLTGAANNYGFFSNIASGSGRYNFYASGTADNYFAGAVGIGDTALTGYTIKVSRSITGATNAVGMQTLSTIQSDVTSSALIFGSKPSTAAAAFTLGTLYHFIAEQGTVGAGSTVTNQYGFLANSSLTGAANNYGFFSNIASGSGRYNFYAAGTAANYFAGDVTVASTNDPAFSVTGGVRIGSSTATGSTRITSGLNWNFSPLSIIRATSNLATVRTLGFMLDGDSLSSTGIGDYNAIWGAYDSAPTTGSTSSALNGAMVYGAYAGHRWYVNGSERMRIDNAGRVGIGGTPSPWARMHVTGTYLSSGGVSIANYSTGAIPSTTTSSAAGFWSEPSTQAATFTLGSVRHFTAHNLSIGAGSTVTNQYGYFANSNLTGATNNYGFFSNIASGSGRYNFYAAGTAENYFAGFVGVGSTGSTGVSLGIGKNITGATSAYGIYNAGAVQSDVTTRVDNYVSITSTQATAFTLTEYNHYRATSAALGASSAITNQFGFHVASSLTTATNNYGFYSNIASGSGRYNFYAAGTADNYFGGPLVVSTSSTSDALRITQTGTGNALVVEDSANPDSTPFVIDQYGRTAIGAASSGSPVSGLASGLGVHSTASVNNTLSAYQWSADSTQAFVTLSKSRGATPTTQSILSSGDTIGTLVWTGSDGTQFVQAARVEAAVDGTPGVNDMPGRLVFSTTADGASSPTERMRIDSAGSVGIGLAPPAGQFLVLAKNPTGSTATRSVSIEGTIQSDVTTIHYGYFTYFNTAAATFTLDQLRHYHAQQGTIGAGSTVTNQYGFLANSTLTGATNNYGFYSSIASGSGRYNFYAAGTADNFFQGPVKSNGTVAGGYVAHAAGTTAMVLGSYNVVKITPNATATFTTTVAPAGATASIIIVTSGTTSYTITFGTGFLTTGTLATGTVTAKTFVVNFVSDGTTMIETSRTVAM